MTVELRDYQREAVDLLVPAGRAIYGDGVGTGKTLGACQCIREWGDARTLVVVPYLAGAGIRRWEDELDRFDLDNLTMHGGPGYREKIRLAYSGGVLLTTYDVLRSDIEHLRKLRFGAVVFDEAHRLKNRNAKVTKAARKVAYKSEHLLLVTATKTLGAPDDLWSLLNLLDPDRYTSYWAWVDEHCTTEQLYLRTLRPGVPQPKVVTGLRDGAADKIKADLAGRIIERHDLLPLDEPVKQVLEVTLSPAERKLYDQLSKHYFAEVGDELLVMPNPIVLQTRLRQISSDWSSLVDGEGPGSKVKATAELIGDLGEPVVVLCAYQNTCDQLVGRIGYDKAAPYHGGHTQEARARNLAAFLNGDISVLVGTIGALGEGVDGLQHRARCMIFLDRDWSPEREYQCIGRLLRDGQTKPVLVWHVAAADTVDADVAKALVRKQAVAEVLRVPA